MILIGMHYAGFTHFLELWLNWMINILFFDLCSQQSHLSFSKKRPPRASFPPIGSYALPPPTKLRPQCEEEDEMPHCLVGGGSPIKASSPNKKRVSPPQTLPGLRSSRKLILQSIPSFPSLAPSQWDELSSSAVAASFSCALLVGNSLYCITLLQIHLLKYQVILPVGMSRLGFNFYTNLVGTKGILFHSYFATYDLRGAFKWQHLLK